MPPHPPHRLDPRLVCGLIAVLVASFVAWDAYVHGAHLRELDTSYGVSVDAPAVDLQSPTGYAGERRSLVLPLRGADTLHWIAQTQQMAARGEWRVRHVDYDNVPAGREVHWASPLRWWLGLLAAMDRALTGRPLGIAVERATLTAGPLMLAVALAGLVPFLARRFSPAAAAVAAVGMIATYPFYTDFIPGRTDHHGLANLCALLCGLFLAAGAQNGGRKWFVASGIAGGAGLWVSAATQTPVLVALALGILGAAWFTRRTRGVPWLDDTRWLRIWAAVGGGASLLAYAAEYFPSHVGMRLEVNHPLYALAWIGGAEVLRVAINRMRQQPVHRRMWIAGTAGALAASILPVAIWSNGERFFTVADPFVWRLHAAYISEFQSLAWHWREQGFGWGMIATVSPLALAALPALRLWSGSLAPEWRALLLLVWVPALAGAMLGCWQVRWLGLAFALSMPMLAVFFATLPGRKETLRWSIACTLAFLPGTVLAVRRTLAAGETTAEEIRALAERDVAHWLRQRTSDEPLVVASSPTTTTRTIAYASARGLGTLYWENSHGLKRAARFFGTAEETEARALAREAGVTHVVLITWNAFEATLAKLHRALPESAPIPADSFLARLLGAAVPPPWLRAVPFKLPDHPALAGQQVLIWEVTPEQSPAAATANAARHYLELGRPELASQLQPLLAGFPEDFEATLMLAATAARMQDATAFGTALQRILARLDRANALDLEGHVHLVVVLAVGQQLELAQQQLAAALRKADARSLRRLTPGTLSDLLALSEALRVPWPDTGLQELARKHLPPSRRE